MAEKTQKPNPDKLDASIKETLYGNKAKQIEDLQDIKTKVSSMLTSFSSDIGDKEGNIIELIASVNNVAGDKGKSPNKSKQYEKTKSRIENTLNSDNLTHLNHMMVNEKERIVMYQNYRMIHKMIPQISEAVKTIVDNIISPDDFTKTSLNISAGNLTTGENQSTFEKNMKALEQAYSIEDKISGYLEKSLTLGDLFIFIDSVGEGIAQKVLTEDEKEDAKATRMLEDEAMELEPLTEDTMLFPEEDFKTKFEMKDDEIKVLKAEVLKFVNESVEITNDPTDLLSESAILSEDYGKLMKSGVDVPTIGNPDTNKEKNAVRDEDIMEINGSIIKELLPERIIKLWADGFNYGYYYIDTVNNSFLDAPTVKGGNSNLNNLLSATTMGSDVMKSKQEFMYELIFSNIIKKLNKKFIKDKPEFKKVIYNALQQKELYLKKLKILYLPPQKVVHFQPNANEDNEYGTSIYADILFTAKLYLSVLISMLMMMLVRGSDKRAWYVETGIEGDQENVINAAIQDIKGREIKMNDFGDLQHVINMVGMFDDYFFPMFEGEKPLDMEIIEGQKPDLENNEFLEYLRKTMISGMGVPSAHLNYTEDIELAKTLTMMNGKLIRRIITYQKAYSKPTTKMVDILYRNEYLKGAEKDAFVPKGIAVTFPSPASLNYTNLQELIGNAEPIISKIVDTLVSDQERAYGEADVDSVRYNFTKEVTKKMIPNIDWSLYDVMLKEVAKQTLKDANRKKEDDAEEDLGAEPDSALGAEPDETAELSDETEEPAPDSTEEVSGGGDEDAGTEKIDDSADEKVDDSADTKV